MKEPHPIRAGGNAGASETPEQARLRWAAMMIAKTPASWEALMAGMAVPRDNLRPVALQALHEASGGPPFVLTYEKALALEVVAENGTLEQAAQQVAEQAGPLAIATMEDFAAVDEPTAVPIIGGEEATILSLGGMMVLYGDGGAGKTTLELDLICHLAAGRDWLGLPVTTRQRILVIENEGPRGMFRKKTRRKLEAWAGNSLDGYVHILEDPWALFSFREEAYREQLLRLIIAQEFDIVAAGPVNRLGMEGGGTPDEVGAFILNIELIRQKLERPVAVVFAHHENKAGDVSGAWEGVPDTLAHIQASGNGKTRVFWQKVRWGPELHGKTWQLNWAQGESFELEEKVEITLDQINDAMLAFITDHPGCSWNDVDAAIEAQAARKRSVRDHLLSSGKIENRGNKRRYILHLLEGAESELF